MIDLRSDTVTRPTSGMRKAMAEAVVGDDVFGEDPTVRRLEETVAGLLGMETALFVSSGVMGNQLALRLNTDPGDEVILDVNAHICNYESGAAPVLSGVQFATLQGSRGLLSAEQVRLAVRGGHDWEARSRLVCLENTHNKAGGVIYPMETIREIQAVAKQHDLRLHLDGARIWNASAATGIAESEYARGFDTVSVCLSKGLGAPVGSVLAGSAETMRHARRFRKMLGGGMRQVGILAAAGLYALEFHRPALAEDHVKARRLAQGLAEHPLIRLDPATVETNIVMFDVKEGSAEDWIRALASSGVLMVPFGPRTIRATTHRDLSEGDIERALESIRGVMPSSASGTA